MTEYRVRTTMTAEEIIEFMMRDQERHVAIVPLEILEAKPQQSQKQPQKQTRHRISKVETTIRTALGEGAQTAKQLREALEHAGMKGSSLAASLANLQKRGEVERSIDGTYAFAKAAE